MALVHEFEKSGNWLFKRRSWLPVVLIIAGVIVLYLTNRQAILYDSTEELIFLGISLFGETIRIYAVGYAPRNTSGRNTAAGQIADELNTTGIYSLVRHPLYVGNFFMWLGPVLFLRTVVFVIIFILVYWLYYERIMFAEEQFLRRKFGKIYIDWADYVPAFKPSFKRFEKPELSFSWKKVLKKEKNGFTAIFIVFALFNILGELVQKKTDFDYVLISGCIVSGLLYLVLKFLKKKTDVLNEEGR